MDLLLFLYYFITIVNDSPLTRTMKVIRLISFGIRTRPLSVKQLWRPLSFQSHAHEFPLHYRKCMIKDLEVLIEHLLEHRSCINSLSNTVITIKASEKRLQQYFSYIMVVIRQQYFSYIVVVIRQKIRYEPFFWCFNCNDSIWQTVYLDNRNYEV
jgi:hypothetical protein